MTDFADENNNKSSETSHIKSLEDNERKDESETTLEHQKRNDEVADNKPDDNASSVSASKKNIGMHCEGNDKTKDGHNIELKDEFTNNDQESSSISVASDDKRDESQDQSDTKEENTGLDGATDVKKNSDQAHNAREKDKDAEKPNASVEKENKSSEKATGIEAPTTNNNINPAEKAEKIKVHFVAVGSAPILKKNKYLMNSNDEFAVAIAFVRKLLKMSTAGGASSSSAGAKVSASSLFLYVNAAFVPSPDERIGDVFACFGVRGELVIHYSLQEAWG